MVTHRPHPPSAVLYGVGFFDEGDLFLLESFCFIGLYSVKKNRRRRKTDM